MEYIIIIKQVQYMKVIGKMIKKLVMELKKYMMAHYMKENSITGKRMAQEYIIGMIIPYILENGQIIDVMVMEYLKMEISLNIKGNSFLIKEMGMEN